MTFSGGTATGPFDAWPILLMTIRNPGSAFSSKSGPSTTKPCFSFSRGAEVQDLKLDVGDEVNFFTELKAGEVLALNNTGIRWIARNLESRARAL